jgi:hypothetical protein
MAAILLVAARGTRNQTQCTHFTGTDARVKDRMKKLMDELAAKHCPFSYERTNGGLTIETPNLLFAATWNGDGFRNTWYVNPDGSPRG